MSFVFAISLFFLIVYTVLALWHLKKVREIDGLFVTIMMYALVFGIVPSLVAGQITFNGSQSRYIRSILDLSDTGVLALIYHYLLSFVGFWAIWFSYYGRFRKGRTRKTQSQISVAKIESENAVLMITAWLCLLIGVLSLILWAKAYGSIFVLIAKANSVRSGQGGVSNSLAYFKHAAKICLLCTFMFFVLVNRQKKGLTVRKLVNGVGLITSAVASYLYLIANDGRLTIVIFLLAILWLAVAGKKRKNVTKLIFFGCLAVVIGIILLSQMDNITYYIRYGEARRNKTQSGLLRKVVSELGFLPRGGQKSIMAAWNGKTGLTILDDLVTGICAWLPTKMKPAGFQDVWNMNTILIFGDLSVSHGQVPCSIVTQGFYDLRFFGSILLCAMLGRFVRTIDGWHLQDGQLMQYVIKANFMEMIFRAIAYFSFYDIILGVFPLTIVMIVYKCVGAARETILRRGKRCAVR